MTKKLDFNSIEPKVLELTMKDDERTVIRVSTPTEALIEEIQLVAPKLDAAINGKSETSTESVYDLAARLISCNRDDLTVTKEELRGKYRMNLENMLIFFSAYIEFINEITHEKN